MGFLKTLVNSVGSGALGAVTSIAGNLLGAKSQSDANKTNLHINQLNNEFNERMMQKQMDYNTAMLNRQEAYNKEMWKAQNAYNDPSEQVKRLKGAGLNPTLMLGQLGAGTAQSAGSTSPQGVSPASAGSSGNAQGYNYNFQGIPDAIIQGKQAKIMDEQYKQWVMDNQTRALKNLAEIDNLIADTKNKNVAHKLSSVQYAYADELAQLAIQNQKQTISNMEQQQKNIVREGLLMQKELDIFDERTRLQFADMVAQRLFTEAQTRTEKQHLIHEVQKMYETVARTKGIKISNEVAKRSSEALVEKAFRDAYSANGVTDFISKGIFGNGSILKRKIKGQW